MERSLLFGDDYLANEDSEDDTSRGILALQWACDQLERSRRRKSV